MIKLKVHTFSWNHPEMLKHPYMQRIEHWINQEFWPYWGFEYALINLVQIFKCFHIKLWINQITFLLHHCHSLDSDQSFVFPWDTKKWLKVPFSSFGRLLFAMFNFLFHIRTQWNFKVAEPSLHFHTLHAVHLSKYLSKYPSKCSFFKAISASNLVQNKKWKSVLLWIWWFIHIRVHEWWFSEMM